MTLKTSARDFACKSWVMIRDWSWEALGLILKRTIRDIWPFRTYIWHNLILYNSRRYTAWGQFHCLDLGNWSCQHLLSNVYNEPMQYIRCIDRSIFYWELSGSGLKTEPSDLDGWKKQKDSHPHKYSLTYIHIYWHTNTHSHTNTHHHIGRS